MKDLKSDVLITQLVDPAVVNSTDVTGASVDLQAHDSLVIAVGVGESGDTLSASVYYYLELEESDDDSTFTDVADADISDPITGATTGTFAKIDAAAEDDAVYYVGYKGSKRYVRPVINAVGTHTNGTPIGAWAIRSHPRVAPAS